MKGTTLIYQEISETARAKAWHPSPVFLTDKGIFVNKDYKALSYSTLIKDLYTIQEEKERQEKKGMPERKHKERTTRL